MNKVALVAGVIVLVAASSGVGVAVGLSQQPATATTNGSRKARCDDALLRRRNADQAAATIKSPQTGNTSLDASLIQNATKEAQRQSGEAIADIARYCS